MLRLKIFKEKMNDKKVLKKLGVSKPLKLSEFTSKNTAAMFMFITVAAALRISYIQLKFLQCSPEPEKYFYISLAPWLIKFKSISPTKFLTSPTNIFNPTSTQNITSPRTTANARFSSWLCLELMPT